jgi:hypothetical protein
LEEEKKGKRSFLQNSLTIYIAGVVHKFISFYADFYERNCRGCSDSNCVRFLEAQWRKRKGEAVKRRNGEGRKARRSSLVK